MEGPETPYHVLSLGAGVNSTALLHILLDRSMPLDEVVFADTFAEKPETYAYLEKWIVPFLSSSGIPYTCVAAKETLIERCLRGHTIPDRRYRWSTRDYKIRPIEKHLKPRAPVVTYLGIASDEAQRVKPARVPWNTHSWPLVDLGMTRADCEKLILSKGWPVPPKSGCFFCPFNRIGEWRELLRTHPDLFQRAVEIEKNGSRYPEFALVDGGLQKLRRRFESEERQRKMDQYQGDEECTGYCMS